MSKTDTAGSYGLIITEKGLGMSIKLKRMISTVIRIDRLHGCPGIGNVGRFLDDQVTNGIDCQHDGYLLVIPGGADQLSAHLSLEFMKSQGLRLTQKTNGEQRWRDICLVDSVSGPTLPCPWLDWNALDGTVALKESERPVGTVIIAHGKESGPNGNKIMALAHVAEKLGFKVIRPDFRGMDDPDQRVEHLLDLLLGASGPLFLAGSSMGGYVALKASQVLDTDGLFLIAPAIGISGYQDQQPEPGCREICVVHAWQDEVIPVGNVMTWAEQYQAELHLVESDHRLTNKIDLLKALFRDMLKRPRKQTTFICPKYL